MDTDRTHKQALKYRRKGKRSIGRQRERWKDQLHLDVQRTGTTTDISQFVMMKRNSINFTSVGQITFCSSTQMLSETLSLR
jgi:hypothetical protein